MLTAVDLYNHYRLLGGEEKALVDLLAVAYSPLPVPQLDKALQPLGVKRAAQTLANLLVKTGVIEVRNHFNTSYGGGAYYGSGAAMCAPTVVERITRQLAAEGRFGKLAEVVTAAAPFPKPFGRQHYFENLGQVLRFARMAFYQGDFARIDEIFAALAQPGALWMSYREDYRWLDRATFFALVCGNPFDREPREQKRAGRDWSRGKRLTFDKLAELSVAGSDALLEQDSRVVRHLGPDRYRLRQILKQRAWLALVGHPHLLWAASFQPLELVSGQLELRVTKLRGDAVQIALVPEFADDQEVVLWSEAPSRLKVAEITEAHRRIGKALGKDGLTVPLSARDKVLEALSAVASLVTVHSDIGGASGTSALVAADGAPRVHLSPEGGGLLVEVLVRPFGGVGPYYPPGEGGKALFIEAEGKRLHTERDLPREKGQAAAVVAACEVLGTAEHRHASSDCA